MVKIRFHSFILGEKLNCFVRRTIAFRLNWKMGNKWCYTCGFVFSLLQSLQPPVWLHFTNKILQQCQQLQWSPGLGFALYWNQTDAKLEEKMLSSSCYNNEVFTITMDKAGQNLVWTIYFRCWLFPGIGRSLRIFTTTQQNIHCHRRKWLFPITVHTNNPVHDNYACMIKWFSDNLNGRYCHIKTLETQMFICINVGDAFIT